MEIFLCSIGSIKFVDLEDNPVTFCMTFWLMKIQHHTRFACIRFSSSEDIIHPYLYRCPILPDTFCKFLDKKISDLRTDLDKHHDAPTFSQFTGFHLSSFSPVSEDFVQKLIASYPI